MESTNHIYALHGNLGSADDWVAVEAAAGRKFQHLDLWGSVRPYELWARDTLATLEPGGVLLGYSLGGRLAMQLLKWAPPGFFRAAILISTHPGLRTNAEREARCQLDATWAQRAREWPWESFWEAWEAQPVFAGTQARAWRLAEHAREAVAHAFVHWSLGLQEDFRPLLQQASRLPKQCYWVTGERDAKFAALAQEVGSPWQQIILPGGHRLPWDAAQALAEIVHRV
jgi:2-succinyl-6-hydroxy-2,4-cyclohexadiene-1-carboxylate synthase